MSEQKKLSTSQFERIAKARDALFGFNWEMTDEGFPYWQSIYNKLNEKAIHCTSDGKPYVEPERWRVPTDEDAIGRPKCRVRDNEDNVWKDATLIFVQEKIDATYPFTVINEISQRDNYRYCEILDTPEEE